MSTLESLEREVLSLPPEEYARFREWFLEQDWEAWDRQIEADSRAGKLDELADRARTDYAAGRTKPI